MEAGDVRFGGLSALAFDQGGFLAVSDRGAVVRFDMPGSIRPSGWIADFRQGPGPYGKKWGRDAESLARDPHGLGWWVGYEQRHSLWLYNDDFSRALSSVDLSGPNWSDNRGAEGLIVRDGDLLVLAENGSDAVRVRRGRTELLKLHSDSDVAEAATAPDGSGWVLLRKKTLNGVEQSIAPLQSTHDGYRLGPIWPIPRESFDNFEGMAITPRDNGGWRFWLVTDDGHRVMARTLLVALDLDLPVRHDKSPAQGAGLSKKPVSRAP